jgi:hypothetical protein
VSTRLTTGQHPEYNSFNFSIATCWRLFYKRTKSMNKSKIKAEENVEKMSIIHSHAAGIDVGSRSHYVATRGSA